MDGIGHDQRSQRGASNGDQFRGLDKDRQLSLLHQETTDYCAKYNHNAYNRNHPSPLPLAAGTQPEQLLSPYRQACQKLYEYFAGESDSLFTEIRLSGKKSGKIRSSTGSQIVHLDTWS